MKYFEVLAIVVFFVTGLALFWRFNRRLKRDYYGKIITRGLLAKACSESGFFISRPVRKSVEKLLKAHSKSAKERLAELSRGEVEPTRQLLQKHPLESAGLTALTNPVAAQKEFDKLFQRHPQKGDSLILSALIDFYFGRGAEAESKREQAEGLKISLFGKGLNSYLKAAAALQAGDLLTASENGLKAAKLFRRDGAFYEEAKVYFLLGTIYRISAVSDIAQLMLTTAADIFKNLGADKDAAETIGSRGMLMAAENRQEESAADFNEALTLFCRCGDSRGEADIYNQQALSFLMTGNLETATELAKTAEALQAAAGNTNGLGLSAEILSRIAAEEKDWFQSAAEAAKARSQYEKSKNLPGRLEAMLLQAQAETENNNSAAAEELLRELIELAQKEQNCFHIANAYNQLGILFMKQGDFQRAKGLFQQSLLCESSNNRTDGMAIDYANLALIEYRLGQREQGDKTVQTALEYAKAFGESELSRLLEEKLNSNRVQP